MAQLRADYWSCIVVTSNFWLGRKSPLGCGFAWRIVKIHGSGFDDGSFALFDGAVPRTNYRNEALLEAEVKKNITGSSGTKKVEVHTSGGDLSNQVDFEVKPKRR
jgi:hypothetical protein